MTMFSTAGVAANTINAVGQLVSLYVPAGGAARVNIDGTFSGTFSFQFNQGGANSAVNLLNMATGSATDQSATAAGSWLFCPTSGNGGVLTIQASAWTSGTAIVSIVDLIAAPQKINVCILPSAARTTAQTGPTIQMPAGYRGLIAYLNITAASGTGGLTAWLSMQDPVSGQFAGASANNLTPTTKATTGLAVGILYPAALTIGTGFTETAGIISGAFRVNVAVGDASSYTYSLSADLIP